LASRDIQVLKTYGAAPYGTSIKKLEKQIKEKQQSVDEKIGVKVGFIMLKAVCHINLDRNLTQDLRHRIYGISLPIANECPKSSPFR
jgi:hypothetical protein